MGLGHQGQSKAWYVKHTEVVAGRRDNPTGRVVVGVVCGCKHVPGAYPSSSPRLRVEDSHEEVDILVVVGNQGGVVILKQRHVEWSYVPIVAWECRAQPVSSSTGAA